MKLFAKNLKELQQANVPEIYEKVYNGLNTYAVDENDQAEMLDHDFEFTLGGHFYLVETAEDLSQIYTAKLKPNADQPSYYTLAEQPGTFDICEYCGDFVYLLMCTHNGGGNTYLIPISIAEQNPNVIQSIVLTAENN